MTHDYKSLLEGHAYPHAPARVRVCETHISWVFLTGPWAYKIKKPLRTPYLDYSTLELRRKACEAELELNRRFAPELYHSVVPVVLTKDGMRVEERGEPIEYAVKMKQFTAGSLFSEMLQSETLRPEHILAAAHEIAAQHRSAPVAKGFTKLGAPDELLEAARANFKELDALSALPAAASLNRERIKLLSQWTDKKFYEIKPLLERRRDAGLVRECHGDMHLGNVIWLEDRVRLFDGVEFNASFRWLDVWNDLSFLLMDLEEHQRSDLAGLLRNGYLEASGDYEGFMLEPWFKLYRAMVRAKVALMKSQDADIAENVRGQAIRDTQAYIDYGYQLLQSFDRGLVMTHGASGSGKTTMTQPLLSTGRCIRVRSDVERKRLHGLGSLESSGGEQALYNASSTAATYAQLGLAAQCILEGGGWAILDATFLKAEQRKTMQELAERHGVPWYILDCKAPPEVLERRVEERLIAHNDASEATSLVVADQLKHREPLTDAEHEHVTTVESLLKQM